MIELSSQSNKAAPAASYALGLGLTNECDLSCAHCYRSTLQLDRLSLADVRNACSALPVSSVSLGVGENGLHPQYHEILDWLHTQGIRAAVTTNGYSIEVLSDLEVARLHSVEFSIDFPTEAEQDNWRSPGNWQKCWEGLARCRRLGVSAAVMAVMMPANYLRLAELARVAARHGADLRFNLYQPVKGDTFSLTYEQLWAGLTDLLARTEVIAISEPLVNALINAPQATSGSPCGQTSLRVLPDRRVAPCAYWPVKDRRVSDLQREGPAVLDAASFQETRQVPVACQDCRLVQVCGGGCASRRKLRGWLDQPDEYCPVARGDRALLERLAALQIKFAPYKDMPKVGNACTFMVRGRPEQALTE